LRGFCNRDVFIKSSLARFIFAIGIDFSLIAAIGISNTVLQILTEVSMRGRVLGVYLSFNWGITAIATMLLGFLASGIGTEPLLNIIGAAAILAGIIYILSIKKQRPMLNEMHKERDMDEGHELILKNYKFQIPNCLLPKFEAVVGDFYPRWSLHVFSGLQRKSKVINLKS
jgi:MFS family permease